MQIDIYHILVCVKKEKCNLAVYLPKVRSQLKYFFPISTGICERESNECNCVSNWKNTSNGLLLINFFIFVNFAGME